MKAETKDLILGARAGCANGGKLCSDHLIEEIRALNTRLTEQLVPLAQMRSDYIEAESIEDDRVTRADIGELGARAKGLEAAARAFQDHVQKFLYSLREFGECADRLHETHVVKAAELEAAAAAAAELKP